MKFTDYLRESETYKPPVDVAKEAQRALDYREKYGDEVKAGTKVNPENKDTPHKDNGFISYLLWGGEAGKRWAEKIIKDNQ